MPGVYVYGTPPATGKCSANRGVVKALAEKVDAQGNLLETSNTVRETEAEAITALLTGMDALNSRMEGFTDKVVGLTDDIALVKGGHAFGAMRRNAALIADDLGCQLIEELPQGVVVGFAKVAADNGEPDNEVDSFRHADMVMHVRDAKGHPGYVAWRLLSRSVPTTSGGQLNQYQGGMSISGVLKTISRTPRRLTSPLRPNWGRPAVRSSDMHISPWLQFSSPKSLK